MPVTDSISDFLTRIRNAGQAKHKRVEIPGSKVKVSIAEILKDQGYIEDFEFQNDQYGGKLIITLRYFRKEPAFKEIIRISKPGRRLYAGADEMPRVRNGLGIAIISTSHGIMSNKEAKKKNIGGEVLCSIW